MKIEPSYICPHCKNAYKTEEEALKCPKLLSELVQEGDVINFSRLRYGFVHHVDENASLKYISVDANKDYVIATGHSVRDYFEYKKLAYRDFYVCGGDLVHSNYLMPQKEADDMVKDLAKRLAAAKSLQERVWKMWDGRK
jgi:hypothetical protein